MIFGYELIATDIYTIPAYQHVISPDKQYQPLVEVKPQLKIPVLSIPVFKIMPKKTTVYFDFDSYHIKPSEKEKLKSIKGIVVLKGYASPEGSQQYNIELSRKRIESVKQILRNVSISREEALGEDTCNLPEHQWHLCRKVEIIREE
ncbi:OmpA family protein [Persephonella sp.]